MTDMRDMHADRDLSAYLDGELSPAERERVEAYLAGSEDARARLGELGQIARLVGELPSPRPSRSLVPRVTERWNGLRLLRSISAIATGAFLFAFLLTSVGRLGNGLGGGDASTAIFGGEGATTAANAPAVAPLSASAAPSVPPFAAAPAPAASRALSAAQSTAPSSAAKDLASAGPQVVAPAPATVRSTQTPQPLLQPLVWLALAILAGLAAVVAHLRLRSR